MKNLAKFLTFISAFFVQLAGATTYYVSTNGSDSNPGTSGSPFLTLGKAESVVTGGDVVMIADGTYNIGTPLSITHNGSVGNYITFKAVNPGNVILNGWISIDAGYRVFEGFAFTQSTNGGRAFWIKNANNLIKNCTVNVTASTGYGIQVGTDANTGGEAADNNVLDNVRVIGTSTGTIHGIIFGGGGSGNVLKNSYISNTYYGIVDKAETNTLIYNNVFNFTAASLYTCIYGKGATNSQYYNNVLRSSSGSYGVLMAASDGGTPLATGIVINNNVFIKNSSDPSIYNGTTGTNTFISDYNCYQYTSGTVFFNSGATSYSSLSSWQSASGQDAHSIAGSPTFTNSSGTLSTITDYKPTSTSPVIDAGIAIASRTTDAANNSMSGKPDIGPYEFGGAAAATNKQPAANAGPDQSFFFPTNSTTLTGSGIDADGTISSYQWTKIQGPAQYNIASPTLAKTSISNLEIGVYLFELTVTDNSGATGKDTVQITVNASSNQAPVANAGNSISIVLPTNSASLDGSSSSDADGSIVSYQWTKVFGPSSFVITDPSSKTTGVNSMVQGVYQFELKVTDDKGAVGKDTVKITVNAAAAPANQAPIADAGPDMNITLPNNSITLSGSANDPDGTIASSQWTKVSGPSQFTIESATQEQTVVDNLVQGTYKFELRVTDNAGANAKDTVLVTVNGSGTPAQNQAPTANAGPDINITLPNNRITLSGSGTDADGSIASYLWTKFSGPSQYNITSATQNQTGVNNLTQGIYKFELKVTDNSGASARDTVWVTVNAAAPANQAPKATAGPDITITLPTNSATLSGGGSDPDGTITSYQWKKVSGPSQYNIASSTVAITSVGNLAQGTYKFELTVTDNGGASARDTMLLIVNTAAAAPNKVPVANAGLDLNITLPTNSVILSGSGSDPDGTIAAYKWTKISGPSQSNIVSSTKAQTTVNNLSQGIYQFELTVTDNSGATAMDAVQVTVNPAPSQSNHPPTANAGSNQVITLPANSVTLSGSGTDADGKIASYQWRKVSGPSEYNISSSTKAKTSVDNLVEGSYEFELTVTDNSGATAKATVQVTVNPAPLVQNKAPEASAGSDLQTMLPMDTITLSGNGSDDDGTIASYKWEKISGPSQYSIVSPSKSRTLVRNLKEGIYEFELTVTDNAGAFAKDTVELAVISAPKSFARVFPNPATNVVNIQIEPTTKTTKAALRIYDNKGLLVFQEDFVRQQQGMIKQVSIIKLPSGIYFAELQTDINNIVTLRFMKK